jgi:hypothetical protein
MADSKRRWFQFGLRTMFAVITVFGVWLGWQLKIVRDRHAVFEWIEINGGAYWTPASQQLREEPGLTPMSKTVPIWRSWLGDEPIEGVHMPLESTDSEFAGVQRILTEIPYGYPLKRRGGVWFSNFPVDEESFRQFQEQLDKAAPG